MVHYNVLRHASGRKYSVHAALLIVQFRRHQPLPAASSDNPCNNSGGIISVSAAAACRHAAVCTHYTHNTIVVP